MMRCGPWLSVLHKIHAGDLGLAGAEEAEGSVIIQLRDLPGDRRDGVRGLDVEMRMIEGWKT